MKLHPEKYVMVTYEGREPIYIAPCSLSIINITDKKEQAEVWTALDNPTKLDYHKAVTGYKGLVFEQV